MIRLNGEKMRLKLGKLLVSNGHGIKKEVNGRNGNGNGINEKKYY